MLTLAIETSELQGSIALLEDARCLEERRLELGRQHGQTLVPEIQRLLHDFSKTPRDCTLVSVSIGPGSYTGLRVGVVCAKTLAYSAGCRLIGIDTLRAIAANAPPQYDLVTVVTDAQRDLLYLGRYSRSPNSEMEENSPVTIIAAADLDRILTPSDLLTGAGVSKLSPNSRASCPILPPEFHPPRAACVGRLGRLESLAGNQSSPMTLAPLYLRQSSAETQWDKLHPSESKE